MSISLLATELDALMKEQYQNSYPDIMYQKEILPASGAMTTLSILIANDAIKSLVAIGTQILMDQRFNKLMISHSKQNFFSLAHSVLASEFLAQELPPSCLNDDAEPELDSIDNWSRYHINFQKKSEPEQTGHFDWDLAQKTGVLLPDDKKLYTKAKEKAKRHLLEIEKQEVPKPVDLREEGVQDKFESNTVIMLLSNIEKTNINSLDRLREENELKRERDHERQLQEQVALEASAKLKHISKDRSKRFHTFDFDGKVIYMRPVNQETLPPFAHLVGSNVLEKRTTVLSKREIPNIMEGPSIVTQKTSENKEILPGKFSKFKQKAITDDKDLIKELKNYKPPYVWEFLQPTAGVTLKEGGKQKQGPSFSVALSAKSTTNTSRITKTQYQDKMRSGVIFRETERSSSIPQFKTEHLEVPNKMMNSNKQPGAMKKKFAFLPPIDTQEVKPEITVHSSRLLEVLTKENEIATQISALSSLTDRQMLSTRSANIEGIKILEDDTMKTNKVDEFNMHILQTNDWGKQANVHNMNQNPLTFPKLHRTGTKPILGLKLKLPRERNFRHSGLHSPESPLKSLRESKTKDFF